jgi:hypothetical protein
MTTETTFDFEAINEAAFAAAAGTYQTDLLTGDEAWSGGTLKGNAKKWGAKYAASRRALLVRLNQIDGVTFDTKLVYDERIKRETRRLVVRAEGSETWMDWQREMELTAHKDGALYMAA